MKEIFKKGASVFLRLIIINVMCFFIVISCSVLTSALFTKNIGYKAYGTTSDSSEMTELYTYYYEDGEDTKKADYEEQGYTIEESKISTEMSSKGKNTFLIVTQILSLGILVGFVYPEIWHLGSTDNNMVNFKHKTKDILKGFKIGLTACIPFILFTAFLCVAGAGVLPKFPMFIYKFINSSLYSLIDITISNAATVGSLEIWQFILLFVIQMVTPLISFVAYVLGYKNFSISEKLIYKKNQ